MSNCKERVVFCKNKDIQFLLGVKYGSANNIISKVKKDIIAKGYSVHCNVVSLQALCDHLGIDRKDAEEAILYYRKSVTKD